MPPLRVTTLVFLMMSASLLIVMLLYVLLPLGPVIADRYDVGPAQATLVTTAFGVPYAVGLLLWGTLSDRIGRERVIVPGLVVTAAATLVVAMAGTFSVLLAGRAAQGFAASSIPSVALTAVTERLPPHLRGTGISAMTLAFLSAAPLGQLVGEAIGEPKVVMIALALAFLAIAAGVAWLADRSGSGPDARAGMQPGSSLWRDPIMLAAWGASATLLLSYVSANAGLQHLRDALPIKPGIVQRATLPVMLLNLAAGPLIRRVGSTRSVGIGLAGIVAGLSLMGVGSAATILGGAGVLTAGLAIGAPSLVATIAERASPGTRGRAIAVNSFVLYVGAGIAPVMTGALAPGGLAAICLPAALLVLLPSSCC